MLANTVVIVHDNHCYEICWLYTVHVRNSGGHCYMLSQLDSQVENVP